MKKILLYTLTLANGGVETSLYELIKELKKEPVDITVCTYQMAGSLHEKFLRLCDEHVKIKELGNARILHRFAFDDPINAKENFVFRLFNKLNQISLQYLHCNVKFKILGYALRKFEQDTYDVILDYHSYGYFWTHYAAKQGKDTKKGLWIHDEDIHWLQHVTKDVSAFTKIFCVSPSTLHNFRTHFPKLKDKAVLCYNIIDEKRIQELAAQAAIAFDQAHFHIITVGRLEAQKGYDLLLDTAVLLKKKRIPFCWRIIGNGHEQQHLEERIKTEKLQGMVCLEGFVENPFAMVAASSLYVQTSRHEGFGLAVAEARILKKVVVCTDLACFRLQIQDRINGFLCEDQAAAFADVIEFLYQNPQQLHEMQKHVVFSEQGDSKPILDLLYDHDAIQMQSKKEVDVHER